MIVTQIAGLRESHRHGLQAQLENMIENSFPRVFLRYEVAEQLVFPASSWLGLLVVVLVGECQPSIAMSSTNSLDVLRMMTCSAGALTHHETAKSFVAFVAQIDALLLTAVRCRQLVLDHKVTWVPITLPRQQALVRALKIAVALVVIPPSLAGSVRVLAALSVTRVVSAIGMVVAVLLTLISLLWI